RDASGGAADLTFRRGDDAIAVRLQRASPARHLTRIGEIDVIATRVDAPLARELGGLVHVIGAWLSRHGAGAQLLALPPGRAGPASRGGRAPRRPRATPVGRWARPRPQSPPALPRRTSPPASPHSILRSERPTTAPSCASTSSTRARSSATPTRSGRCVPAP